MAGRVGPAGAGRRDRLRTTTNGTALDTNQVDACEWTRAGSAICLTIKAVGAIPGTWDESAQTLDFTIGRHVYTFLRS